jgi:glycosyltransferase involved in cell wall biosynthesis
MKISLITPPSKNIEPLIPVFVSKGIDVLKNNVSADCDFILNTSCASTHLMESFHLSHPNIPIINLVLDLYETVWSSPNPHSYQYKKYLEYIKKSIEVWPISSSVHKRMLEYGVDKEKVKTLLIWARFFDYPAEGIIDKRYILNPVREYKYDKNYGWLKKACYELQIPLAETKNNFSERDFQRVIAECSFTCCEVHEMSTGGLTLLEGLRHGKPAVVSNSEYEGARDYLGDMGIYFNDKNYEDFKQTIKETWESTPKLDVNKCIQHCNSHVSKEQYVENMINRMTSLI